MARNTTIRNAFGFIKSSLFNPQYFWTLAVLAIIVDGVLTELIIKFIPCAYHMFFSAATHSDFRYRDRLEDLYGPDGAIYQRPVQLYPNHRAYWTSGVRIKMHSLL